MNLTTNCTGNNSVPALPLQELFIDPDYVVFTEVVSVTCSCLSLVGTLGNALAIKTFLSMGLSDGVTVSFLFLAISDFIYLIAVTANSVSLWFYAEEKKDRFQKWYSIDPFGVYIFSANVGIMMYLMTVLTTTFIAVIRCLCVALPLRFKNLFNRTKSTITLVSFFFITVLSYLPILINMKMVVACDGNINASRTVLWISSKRNEVKQDVWLIRDVFVTLLTQGIIVISVAIMIRCLRRASTFRKRHSESQTRIQKPEDISLSLPSQQSISTLSENFPEFVETRNSYSDKNISNKEVMIARQVVLISAVYIVANIPKIAVDLGTFVVPDFTLGRRYQNVYLAIICAMELSQGFNSSLNMIIYYKYNSKFRKHFKLMRQKTVT